MQTFIFGPRTVDDTIFIIFHGSDTPHLQRYHSIQCLDINTVTFFPFFAINPTNVTES